MPKRKSTSSAAAEDGDITMVSPSTLEGGDDDSDSSMSLVNVDFEMFDPQPQDFHSLKSLLRQLFGPDAAQIPLSAIADVILSQPTVGTTVKTGDHSTDAYAFMTVLNLHTYWDNAGIQTLTEYVLSKSGALRGRIEDVMGRRRLGLVLAERLVNMPIEVVPPMYGMLLEEMQWAVDDGEPFEFDEYLLVSKTYTEVMSRLDDLDDRPTKKGKKKEKREGVFYYHPEDEIICGRLEEGRKGGFEFTNKEVADSKRAFSDMGIVQRGLMMLVGKKEFAEISGVLGEMFKQ